jgi:hypothetical protein
MTSLPTAQIDPHANQLHLQPHYQTGKYGLVQSKKDKRFPCLTDTEHLVPNLDNWNVRCISISIKAVGAKTTLLTQMNNKKDLNGLQSCNTNAAESIQPAQEKLVSTDKGIIS